MPLVYVYFVVSFIMLSVAQATKHQMEQQVVYNKLKGLGKPRKTSDRTVS
jgi:hypothetical protein